jgi:hypothetical protein
MHDKLGCPSAGVSAYSQVTLPYEEGAKSLLGLHLRHNKRAAGILSRRRRGHEESLDMSTGNM